MVGVFFRPLTPFAHILSPYRYDPAAITTRGGALEINLTKMETHNLSYQGGLMSSWNKFCFTGGLIVTSVRLPGMNNIFGLWPAVWTMCVSPVSSIIYYLSLRVVRGNLGKHILTNWEVAHRQTRTRGLRSKSGRHGASPRYCPLPSLTCSSSSSGPTRTIPVTSELYQTRQSARATPLLPRLSTTRAYRYPCRTSRVNVSPAVPAPASRIPGLYTRTGPTLGVQLPRSISSRLRCAVSFF
jgi:hypothetical protein